MLLYYFFKNFWLFWVFVAFTAKPLCAKLLQSYLTLCDLMDCSAPGSSVLGIPQVGTLE